LTLAATANDRLSIRSNWDGSVRGRVGYLVAPDFLVFGTGGVAIQNFRAEATCSGSFPGLFMFCIGNHVGSDSTTRVGWTLGAGIEKMLGGNWIGRVEYRYADYGNFGMSVFTPSPLLPAGTLSVQGNVDASTHIASVGISYRFRP
jgi:outer membrane immunogenic protein